MVAIQFGDEVGLISDRMCFKCDYFVYLNASHDPSDKFDVYVYLCLNCNERLLPIECESYAQKEYLDNFIADLADRRMKLAQEKKQKKTEEQQMLWEL
jgi:hypothetical protein